MARAHQEGRRGRLHLGQGQGEDRYGPRGPPEGRARRRRRAQHRQAPHQAAAAERARRRDREGGADPLVQRGAHRPEGRPPHAGSVRRGRRQEGPGGGTKRREARLNSMMADENDIQTPDEATDEAPAVDGRPPQPEAPAAEATRGARVDGAPEPTPRPEAEAEAPRPSRARARGGCRRPPRSPRSARQRRPVDRRAGAAAAHARDLRARDPPEAPGRVRVQLADAASEHHQDHPQHGRRRGQAELEVARRGGGAARPSSPGSARSSRRRASRSRSSSFARAWPSAAR